MKNILQVGSGDIWTCSSNIPFDRSGLWKESFLVRSKEVASYIPTNSFTSTDKVCEIIYQKKKKGGPEMPRQDWSEKNLYDAIR